MPYPPRLELPDGLFHVVVRGVDGCLMFLDGLDRDRLLKILKALLPDYEVVCHGYCVMSTHVHLLLDGTAEEIAAVMQRLLGPYAKSFNKRHGRFGHLTSERYLSIPVESDEHLLEVHRYVVLNPERAGVARAEEWPWSSYGALLGLAPVPPYLAAQRVLELFGPDTETARRRLRDFVENAPRQAKPSSTSEVVEAWLAQDERRPRPPLRNFDLPLSA